MMAGLNVTTQQLRTAVVAMLKAKITSTADIRELEYQGTDFDYPFIRYSVAYLPDDCKNLDVQLGIYIWSEGDSSLEAEQIGDEVISKLHNFSYSNGTTTLENLWLTNAPRVFRNDDRLWRREVYFRCKAVG